MNLVQDRDVVEMLGSVSGVRRRTEAGKSPEVVDEVSLIEITALQRHSGPVHLLAGPDATQDLLKAPDAAKQFWRQPHLISENVDKAPGAEADLASDVGYRWSALLVSKYSQGEMDCRMP